MSIHGLAAWGGCDQQAGDSRAASNRSCALLHLRVLGVRYPPQPHLHKSVVSFASAFGPAAPVLLLVDKRVRLVTVALMSIDSLRKTSRQRTSLFSSDTRVTIAAALTPVIILGAAAAFATSSSQPSPQQNDRDRALAFAATYAVGETGPGGGIIFYVAETPFRCGPALQSACTYLEGAPAGWNGEVPWPTAWDSSRQWKTSNTTTPGTSTVLGSGYANTYTVLVGESYPAAAAVREYETTVGGVSYSDWFLPSRDELLLLHRNRRAAGLGGFAPAPYWSSSTPSVPRPYSKMSNWPGPFLPNSNTVSLRVRPVRAF